MKELFNKTEVTSPIYNGITPQVLYRRDIGEDRYYYDKEGNAYLSVTSAVSKMLPTSIGMLSYYASKGMEAAKAYADKRAAYGDIMHISFTEVLRAGGRIDFDYLFTQGFEAAIAAGASDEAIDWGLRLQKDTAAFAKFLEEKEVEVIAVELPVANKEFKVAGCIDLVAQINFNKKQVLAIIDYKSKQGGSFYESHELQLGLYKYIFQEYHGMEVEMLFNWSPNDFRKLDSPTYTLKNQSNSIYNNMRLVKAKLWVLNEECKISPPTFQQYTGKYTIGEGDFSKNIIEHT